MSEHFTEAQMLKIYRSGSIKRTKDELLREQLVKLEVDGKREVSSILSCGNERYWALGHMVCRRMISSLNDIEYIQVSEGLIEVKRALSKEGLDQNRPHLHTDLSAFTERGENISKIDEYYLPKWKVPLEAVFSSLQELQNAPLFRRTGCVHVALLASWKGEVLFRVEDIGRHNTVDKAIGWAVEKGINRGDCFLVISGRLPADMVQKASEAGIPMMVSVSAVTEAGLDHALKTGITLVGFAREGRLNVYSVPERIDFPLRLST